MTIDHPPKDRLIAFGQGKLAAEESSSVEQHLEVCRECCETVLDLTDDTFEGLVRTANPGHLRPERLVPAEPQSSGGNVETSMRRDFSNQSDAAGSTPDITLVKPGRQDECLETVLHRERDPLDGLPAELKKHPRYRIVELIGRGGMGNVYRAEHRLMNRAVAVKVINSQLMQNRQAVERFRREVQAAARLSHPNIVAAHDAEQAGNAHFLVMEFVEGTDLASVIKQRGPMSVAEACECIRQAALGLQHAYERGMVHRDIKPQNLMMVGQAFSLPVPGTGAARKADRLEACPTFKILDFGLAGFASEAVGQAFQPDSNGPSTSQDSGVLERPGQAGKPDLHLTTMGSVMGTPDYMAPEQAADAHSADIRADIYSLGCTLHFLLTGQPPFVADNVLAKLKAHAEQSPPAMRTLRNDVPVELEHIARRMMEKSPAERFQTPVEVATALAPFAGSAVSPPRKRTLRKLLTAAAAILLAGVIFIATDKGRIEIHTEVDDVEVAVKRGGEEIRIIDLVTGSQVVWTPSGDYSIQLKQDRNDVRIENNGFKLSRWGKQVVYVVRQPEPARAATPDIIAGGPVLDKRTLDDTKKQIVASAEAYLQILDRREFNALQPTMSELARQQTTLEGIGYYHQQAWEAFGECTRRELIRVARVRPVPGLPPGNYGAAQFHSELRGGSTQFETLMLNTDPDGKWRVNAYSLSRERPNLPAELPSDEPNVTASRAAQAAEDVAPASSTEK